MLNDEEIKRQIREKGLIKDFIHLETQATPNGFDLTVNKIFEFNGAGALDFSNKERQIPAEKELAHKFKNPGDKFGWWNLNKGAYKVKTNECVSLPNDLVAVAFPRSSLLRMGAFTQTAVWDAGFRGISEFILIVNNPNGIRVKQNARIVQLVFLKINEVAQGYQGIYQERE